jgi:WD40 repeat protein
VQASTLALRELVKRYAMAAFHQTTQRLAIGTTAGIVIIYDLRTATKWRILQGHDGPVSAVAFAAGGDLVASFSAADSTLRWWQAGSSSLLGYFGLHGHCHKVLHVQLGPQDEEPPSGGAAPSALEPSRSASSNGSAPQSVVGVRLEWTSPSTVMLLGRTGKPLGFFTL